MTKVSDSARHELNKLAGVYFAFFILMLALYLLVGLLTGPSFIFIVLALLPLLMGEERSKIIKESKEDKERQQAIEGYHTDIGGGDLTVINENWLNEDFTTVHFSKEDEIEETKRSGFFYEILLNRQEYSGISTRKDIKIHVFLNASKNIIKIDKLGSLALLPGPGITEILLKQTLNFIYFEYRRKKNIFAPDHTLKTIADIGKCFEEDIRNAVLRNYEKIFQVLLSGENFDIAGKIIKNGSGEEIFLITAVRLGEKHITLLPSGTIVNIFNKLNDIALKNKI